MNTDNRAKDTRLRQGKTSRPEFIKHLESFLAHLKARQYSSQSVKKRRDDLRRFFLYLDISDIKHIKDVEPDDLMRYHQCLIDHTYKDTVIESSLRASKLLFDFLQEEGTLFENPASKLKIPKSPVRIGTIISEPDMKRILAAPDISTPVGIRDRAIMETLYATGIRRAELIQLAVHDVDLNRTTLRVKGKDKKNRLLPLGRESVKYLKLYLQHARTWLAGTEQAPDALWISRKRTPLTPNTLKHIITRHRQAAGITTPVDIHAFRRSCATHMLRNGAHPVVVAQLLGHANLSSLAHYLQTTITDLRNTHAKTVLGR